MALLTFCVALPGSVIHSIQHLQEKDRCGSWLHSTCPTCGGIYALASRGRSAVQCLVWWRCSWRLGQVNLHLAC
eukprot:12641938-Prorocentrum_lima.AAC.1